VIFTTRIPTTTGVVNFTVDSADFALEGVDQVNLEGITLFVASWLTLLSDSPITSSRKPLRLYYTFYRRLCRSFRATVVEFTDIAHKVVSRHSLMGAGSQMGDWVDEVLATPVAFEYIRYYHTGDPAIISYLYNFLCFGKKLEYVDSSFDDTALCGWLDCERTLSDLEIRKDDPIVNCLRVILKENLPNPDGDFFPRHGGGFVAERIEKSPLSKNHVMFNDPVLDRFLFHGLVGNYGYGEEHGFSASKVIPDPALWGDRSKQRRRLPARLKFVPKNLKTSRSICMEPATLMFFQQGIADELVRAIEQSVFSRFIRFHDQSYNRKLGLAGSTTGELDTLDLSSASDLVSYELVRAIFPSRWLIRMAVTRSKEVRLPDGSVISVKKFAPMGSALCFPTQSLIYASVCILAALLERGNCLPQTLYEKISRFGVNLDFISQDESCGYRQAGLVPLGVYGDDICCDGKITARVKSILRHLGFRINDDKSFVGSQAFRETCGGYYLGGVDLDPVFYRIKNVRRVLNAGHLVSHVHLINEARRKRYQNLYAFLLRALREWHLPYGKFSMPFLPDTSVEFGIHCSQPVNNHLVKRWNRDLQRDEFQVWSVTYDEVNPADYTTEKLSLMRWWASKRDQNVDDPYGPSGHKSTAGCRVKRRWTPLYC